MSGFSQLLGESPCMQAVMRSARLVAATDVTVLILGPTGTGKELLAKAIHGDSRRAEGPFVAVNCAALPETLAETELFGYARGAFTGAIQAQPGRIHAARQGTLFLDEIGEMPLSIQGKLLRFLENGEIQRVGQPQPERVDVRILAATNRDLAQLVRENRFREDLFHRLNIVPLELPPLCERGSDILDLLDHFTATLAARHRLAAPRFSESGRALLRHYPWPGNVRELKNFCERMVVLCPGREVENDLLPRAAPRATGAFLETIPFPAGGFSLDELESHLIRRALSLASGNRSRAARLLHLTRDTLIYRLKKYAIEA